MDKKFNRNISKKKKFKWQRNTCSTLVVIKETQIENTINSLYSEHIKFGKDCQYEVLSKM
jgi:hypothetical protein